MSIYRRKYHGKRSRFYTSEFTYRGKLYRRSGFVDRESASFWLNSELLKLRRGEVGYVKPMHKALITPLIEQFISHLEGRKCDEKYCYVSEKRLRRLAGECGWTTLGHLTAASLDQWRDSQPLYRGKKIGAKTINQFLVTAHEFGDWITRTAGKLPTNPLSAVGLLRATANQTYRRAGSVEEIDALLSTCPEDRRLFYLFRIYCPLRGKTIARLTWKMLHLDSTPPYLAVPAELNKSRRPEKSPIRYDVATLLRKAKAERKAKDDDLVFYPCPTIDELRADLDTAGVAFDDGKGNRRLDFHAMRKTLIRWCKLAGVSLDAASLLLHHKDVRTTRAHYDDDAVDPVMTDVLEKLPSVGKVRSA